MPPFFDAAAIFAIFYAAITLMSMLLLRRHDAAFADACRHFRHDADIAAFFHAGFPDAAITRRFRCLSFDGGRLPLITLLLLPVSLAADDAALLCLPLFFFFSPLLSLRDAAPYRRFICRCRVLQELPALLLFAVFYAARCAMAQPAPIFAAADCR